MINQTESRQLEIDKLKSQLFLLNEERNKVIQKLRKNGIKHKDQTFIYDEQKEFNKLAPKLIGMCGFKENNRCVILFKITKVNLVNSQIEIYCDVLCINTLLSISYSFISNNIYPYFRTKKFNKLTGTFNIDDVTWIEECEFNNIYKEDKITSDLKNQINILVDRNKKVAEEYYGNFLSLKSRLSKN